MDSCPRCSAPLLSKSRKLFLGPARRIQCGNCGSGVGVSWRWSVPLLLLISIAFPVGAVFGLASIGGHVPSVFAGLIGGLLATVPFCWLYVKFVPLVIRCA